MNTPMVILVGVLLVVLMAVTAGAADMNEQAGARIAAMEQEMRAALEMRDAAVREVAVLKADATNREQELTELQERYNALDAHVRDLDGIIVDLQGQLVVAQSGQQPQIPVTGEDSEPKAVAPKCLISREAVGHAGSSLWIALAGVVALGGGGWAAYRGTDRSVTVRMTRSQLQAYIRYQREGGNRVQ